MVGTAEQDTFLHENQVCVVTPLRSSGMPFSTVVRCIPYEDDLIFSTTASSVKVRLLRRDPRITVTVMEHGEPFGFVTVEGTVTILEGEEMVRLHIELLRVLNGPEWEVRPGFPKALEREGRVIIRVHPSRIYGLPIHPSKLRAQGNGQRQH